MIRKSVHFVLIAAAALLGSAAAAFADDNPALLGAFKDWSAYTTGTSSGKVCYALAKPKSSEPHSVKRDPIYFLISDWPGRKTKAEPESCPATLTRTAAW